MPDREARIGADRHGQSPGTVPLLAGVEGAGALTGRPTGPGWTLVLRRRPIRIVDGEPQGGYNELYELICCYCGDDPDLDYRRVSARLRRIRGPYRIAAGITAYAKHATYHQRQAC
jgi:hypothetical protein